jgi:hypothetical protein
MLKHWMCSFFKDSATNDQPYVINNKRWIEIGISGIEMKAVRKSISSSIMKHFSSSQWLQSGGVGFLDNLIFLTITKRLITSKIF